MVLVLGHLSSFDDLPQQTFSTLPAYMDHTRAVTGTDRASPHSVSAKRCENRESVVDTTLSDPSPMTTEPGLQSDTNERNPQRRRHRSDVAQLQTRPALALTRKTRTFHQPQPQSGKGPNEAEQQMDKLTDQPTRPAGPDNPSLLETRTISRTVTPPTSRPQHSLGDANTPAITGVQGKTDKSLFPAVARPDDRTRTRTSVIDRPDNLLIDIPGTVYFDDSGNGLQEENEPGIPNAVVTLEFPVGPEIGPVGAGQTVSFAETDEEGNFSFTNVPFAFFQIRLDLASLPDNSTLPNTLQNPTEVFHATDVEPVRFGLMELCDIQGFVYLDLNKNQQADEDLHLTGINEVVVELFDLANPDVRLSREVTMTDDVGNLGFYSFPAQAPGTYLVEILPTTLPSRFVLEDKTAVIEMACSPRADSTTGPPDFALTFGITAIKLSEFTATQRGTHVLIAWETALEMDHLAFNVYRSSQPSDPEDLLNQAWILSDDPGNGEAYSWRDTPIHDGRNYYWLEDIDWSFKSTWHGPISVRP